MVLFVVWIVFSLLAGIAGKDKKIGFAGAFLLALFLSPLIGFIVALASGKKKTTRIICDGCQREIKDKYDKVTTDNGMMFDYCSLYCKDSDKNRRSSVSGQSPNDIKNV